MGFEALYPNRYRVLKEVLKTARGNRKEMRELKGRGRKVIRAKVDSKRVSLKGKSCAARPREGWRHAVSKFRGAVCVKITTEDRK